MKMKLNLENKTFLITSVLILAAAATRLFPHAPNFSPVYAIALISGLFINDKRLAFAIPIATMLVSDLFLGFYPSVMFVYFAMALATGLGMIAKSNRTLPLAAGYSIASGLLFFIITNFGVWAVDNWYPKTIAGLFNSYEQGLPFLKWTLASSLLYTVVLFKVIEFFKAKFENEVSLEKIK